MIPGETPAFWGTRRLAAREYRLHWGNDFESLDDYRRGGAMAISNAIAHRIPAGWYPDRFDRTRRRWWDGTEWTGYYSAVPAPQLWLVENEATLESSDLAGLVTPPSTAEQAISAAAPAGPKSGPTSVERIVVETVTTHTLVGALRFSDRVPAFVLLGLVVANIVVLAVLARI